MNNRVSNIRASGVSSRHPSAAFLLLLIWQVILGHPTGLGHFATATSSAGHLSLAGYLRLITMKLITEIHAGDLHLSMHGLWSIRKILHVGIGVPRS